MFQTLSDVVLHTLAPGDDVCWRSLGNRNLRIGKVVSNYPDQERLWAQADVGGMPGVLLIVEYRQLIACGSAALAYAYHGD